MAFDETHTSKPKTSYDAAVEAEKRRKIAEYQAQFIHACHCHASERETPCPRAKDCGSPQPMGT